jgi:hypothetical protein
MVEQVAIHHKSPHALVNIEKKLTASHGKKQMNSLIVYIFKACELVDHVRIKVNKLICLGRLIIGSGDKHTPGTKAPPFQHFLLSGNTVQIASTALRQLKLPPFDQPEQLLPRIRLISSNLLITEPMSTNGYSLQSTFALRVA